MHVAAAGPSEDTAPFWMRLTVWSVVTARSDSGVRNRVMVSHRVELSYCTCVFQIALGNGSVGIGGGDKALLCIWGERVPPHAPLAGCVAVHSSHASLGCVGSPHK